MKEEKTQIVESIELIRNTIDLSRKRLQRDAAMPFIIWGWTAVAVSLAVWYALYVTGDVRWNWLWMVIPVIGGCGLWLCSKAKTDRTLTRTWVDRVMGCLWVTLGAVAFTYSCLSVWGLVPILYTVLLLMGIGTAVSGLVMKSWLLILAGFIMAMVFAPTTLLVKGVDGILIFAAAFLVTMVIPGHVFHAQNTKQDE